MTYVRIDPPITYTTDEQPDLVLTQTRRWTRVAYEVCLESVKQLTAALSAVTADDKTGHKSVAKMARCLTQTTRLLRELSWTAFRPDAPPYEPPRAWLDPTEDRHYGGVSAARLYRVWSGLGGLMACQGWRACASRLARLSTRLQRGLEIQARVTQIVGELEATLNEPRETEPVPAPQPPTEEPLPEEPPKTEPPPRKKIINRRRFKYRVSPHAQYRWPERVARLGYDPRHTSLYWLEREAKAIRRELVGPKTGPNVSPHKRARVKKVERDKTGDTALKMRDYTPPDAALKFDEVWPPIDLRRWVREREVTALKRDRPQTFDPVVSAFRISADANSGMTKRDLKLSKPVIPGPSRRLGTRKVETITERAFPSPRVGSVRQRANKRERAVNAGAVHLFDNRCADDNAVRIPGNFPGAVRRFDAKTHDDGQARRVADFGDLVFDRPALGQSCPGNARHGHVIDKPLRAGDDFGQTGRVCGRGREADQRQIMGFKGGAQLAILLGRQVDNNGPVNPGGFGGLCKSGVAHVMDRIAIAHDDDRGGGVGLSELCGHLEDGGQCGARLARANTRFFDHGAVGHGVGEGNAQLDNINPGIRHGIEQFLRARPVRIAAHHIGDKDRVSVGKGLINPLGHFGTCKTRCIILIGIKCNPNRCGFKRRGATARVDLCPCQDIGFRVIGHDVAARHIIGIERHVFHLALGRLYRGPVSGFRAQRGDICGVHHDAPTCVRAPVTVALLIDDGIKLPFTTQGGERERRICFGAFGQGAGLELRLAGRGIKFRPVDQPPADVKLCLSHVDIGHVLHARDNLSNCVSHGCMAFEGLEIYRTVRQELCGQIGQNDGFGSDIIQSIYAAVAQAHEVKHGFLCGRFPLFIAGGHRQDEALTVGHARDMALVEGGRQEQLKSDAFQGLFGPGAIGIGGIEIAAHNHGGVNVTRMSGLHGRHRIQAFSRGEGDVKGGFHFGDNLSGENGFDSDGANALDVGMTPERQQPRTRAGHHTPHQCQPRNRLNIVHPVAMMGHAHAPRKDSGFRCHIQICNALNLVAGHATARCQLFPRGGLDVRTESLIPLGVSLDEIEILGAALQNRFGEGFEQGHVLTDFGLEIIRGNVTTACEHGFWAFGDREFDQARLFGRIDDDHMPPARAAGGQLMDQSRMVRGRVGANNKDQITQAQICQLHGCGACADGGRQANAGRLVAIIGTVGHIIGPVSSCEELKDKRCLIGRPARRIEKTSRGIRLGQALYGDIVRRIPADGAKSDIAFGFVQGRVEAAESFQLLGSQLLQRVQTVVENFQRNGRLNISGLGLDALIANGGKLSQLIDHAAPLSAHTKRASFAGVVGAQGFGRLGHTDLAHSLERVEYFLRAATDSLLGHNRLPWETTLDIAWGYGNRGDWRADVVMRMPETLGLFQATINRSPGLSGDDGFDILIFRFARFALKAGQKDDLPEGIAIRAICHGLINHAVIPHHDFERRFASVNIGFDKLFGIIRAPVKATFPAACQDGFFIMICDTLLVGDIKFRPQFLTREEQKTAANRQAFLKLAASINRGCFRRTGQIQYPCEDQIIPRDGLRGKSERTQNHPSWGDYPC